MANAQELHDGRPNAPRPAPATRRPPTAERPSWRERLGALRNLPPFLKLVWRTSPALTLAPGAAADRRARCCRSPRSTSASSSSTRSCGWRRLPQRADEPAAMACERPARPHRLAARARVRAGGPVRRARAAPCRCSTRCCRSGSATDQPSADGACGHARPRGLRGQRIAGPARTRAAAGGRAHDADRPAFCAGAGRRHRRRALPPVSSSMRRGSSRLLAIALVPAFIGEAHFNAQSYSLNYARTPERRELDYVRQTGPARRRRRK